VSEPATGPSGWKLRRLPLPLRLGLAAAVLSLAIGEAASLAHLVNHHARKDDEPGLSLRDLEGAYHGVDQGSKLLRSLDTPHVREHLAEEGERAALRSWLMGGRVDRDYDDEDRLGELAPALLLERRCTSCHARTPRDLAGAQGGARELPLDSWGEVSKVAFGHQLEPVTPAILALSTHVHALTLPLVALAVGALALMTSWPARAMRWLVALGSIGLFVDLASWWLAREDFLKGALPFGRTLFVKAIVAGGAAFSLALAAQLLLVLVDLLLPAPRAPKDPLR
jgi:hypothetical protein